MVLVLIRCIWQSPYVSLIVPTSSSAPDVLGTMPLKQTMHSGYSSKLFPFLQELLKVCCVASLLLPSAATLPPSRKHFRDQYAAATAPAVACCYVLHPAPHKARVIFSDHGCLWLAGDWLAAGVRKYALKAGQSITATARWVQITLPLKLSNVCCN
eukprot:SAG31_NODE_260_length_18915_cov_3.432823_1_plen_155_part_10